MKYLISELTFSSTLFGFMFFFYSSSSFGIDKGNTYLCVSKESIGFYFNGKNWGETTFNASEEKFIIRKIKKNEKDFNKGGSYGIFNLGSDVREGWCPAPDENSENIYSKNFTCTLVVGEFFFSPETGRFIKTYTAGYWTGEDNNNDTPSITRGECSKI